MVASNQPGESDEDAPAGELIDLGSPSSAASSGLISCVDSLFGELIKIGLSATELSFLGLVPILLGFVFWLVRDREQLVAVANVQRGETLTVGRPGDGAVVPFRHDAILSTSGRAWRWQHGQTLIYPQNGDRVWAPTENFTDTSY